MSKVDKPWRPKVGTRVLYRLDGQWWLGRVWSYEGKDKVAVDLKCGIARARFSLKDLKKP
jgi:hypothetical protein